MVYMSVLARVMTESSKNNFLTVAEVSGQLRLSVLTIYKYIKSGMLDAVEFGGHYRISETSLTSFIAKHKVHQVSKAFSEPRGSQNRRSGPEGEK